MDELVVIINLDGGDGYYYGIIDVNGQFLLVLIQDKGVGVLILVCVVLFDGMEVMQNVIFIVVISLDVMQVCMWGYMQGVVEVGNIYKCLLLVEEVVQDIGFEFENNEYWVMFNLVMVVINQCGVGQVLG